MKKLICVFAMLVMFGVLCTGCQKTEEPAPTAVEEPNQTDANNWQPETAAPPVAHDPNDGGDHSGHGH